MTGPDTRAQAIAAAAEALLDTTCTCEHRHNELAFLGCARCDAEAAYDAIAPILLAPVQAEVERAWRAMEAGAVHQARFMDERDEARAEVERLRTHLRVTEDDLAATRERCEDALAAAAELEVERDEATAALTELAPLAPILEERRRIAAAIRSNCAASGHVSPARAFLGDPCCAICEASARIAEEDA